MSDSTKINNDLVDMASDLRTMFSTIDGVKSYSEDVVVSYVVVTEDDNKKAEAQKLTQNLEEQAQKRGVNLEITVATETEIETARKQLEQYKQQEKTFKS